MKDDVDFTDEREDVDDILREMADYENEVEDFALRIANALKHKCRTCGCVKYWRDAHKNQGEIMAETARQNVRLRAALAEAARGTDGGEAAAARGTDGGEAPAPRESGRRRRD